MMENKNQKERLLVVDDDENTRLVYEEILSEEGYFVETASTLESAVEELEKASYDLVLADLRLPDGSGLDLLGFIRDSEIPAEVIIVTGYASVENTIEALNRGAFAYMQKPVNMEELKIFIARALKIKKLSADNRALLQRFKDLSLKDPHTGLYNYRYLSERLKKELGRARRHDLPLSVVMIDIDYFKSINDVYGHSYGDRILKDFSSFLKDFVRDTDVVLRYGGEEFVLILTDTSSDGAVTVVRRLLDEVNRHVFDPEGRRVRFTISVGVWSLAKGDLSSTVSSVIDAVDSAMLKAKELGGDRFVEYHQASLEGAVSGVLEKGIEDFREKIDRMQKRANQSVVESIYALAKTIEAKQSSISEHAEDMVAIVGAIGRKLGLEKTVIEKVKQATLLHDLGKIGIPDSILSKKGPLTPEEYEVVRKHPQIGAEIVRSIHSLNGVSQMILYHHERYNGLGYPRGLKGDRIPLASRIIAIVDVYQALISARPYHSAYTKEQALSMIEQSAGSDFDPEIVSVFLEVVREGDYLNYENNEGGRENGG